MKAFRSSAVINKSAVIGFLDEFFGVLRLGDTDRVFAPVLQDDVLCLAPVESAEEIIRGVQALIRLTNTRQAPKEVFFPRSEVLFSYQDGKVIPVELPEERRVVFAMRPCDARSAVLLDYVFDADADEAAAGGTSDQDPYYMNRRKNTVLMGLACNQPMSTCFCTSVGGGPFSTDGLDLLWTDLGDRYLVEAITEQGAALIANSPHMREAGSEDIAQKAEIAALAEQAVSGPDVQGVKEKLDTINWDIDMSYGIASNQAGVALGYLSEDMAYQLLKDMFVEAFGGWPRFQSLQVCPHLPDAGCECRKPKTLMIRNLVGLWCVGAEDVLFVGDMDSDRQCAENAGVDFMWAKDFFGWEDER